MKKIIFSCIFLIMSAGILSTSEPVRFVYAEYWPANYMNESGNHEGFFIDIIRELFEQRLKTRVEIGTYPWARCQYMIEQGLADFMATIPTTERLEYTTAVDTPFWIKNYRLYTYTGNSSLDLIEGIQSVDGLKNSGLVFISYIGNNWSKTTLEERGIPVINAKNPEGMYMMLAAGRGDVIAEDPILADSMIGKLGLEKKIILTEGLIDKSNFNFLIGKKSPLAIMVPLIDHELEIMWEEGKITQLIEAYGSR